MDITLVQKSMQQSVCTDNIFFFKQPKSCRLQLLSTICQQCSQNTFDMFDASVRVYHK